jgi:peroxiredoxin
MYQTGDYLPWFSMQTTAGFKFVLEKLGGRYVVLCFFGSTANPFSRRVLDDIESKRERFNGSDMVFVGVSFDPKDATLQAGWEQAVYLCDSTGGLGRMQEVISKDGTQFQPQTIVLDPMLRVAANLPFAGEPDDYLRKLREVLNGLPPLASFHDGHAPIIILPNVFEREFCRALIDLYKRHGGRETGGLIDQGGQTVRIIDHELKSRSDHVIVDQHVKEAALWRISRRLVPEVQRAFQFKAECVERHIVACYDAASGGHFSAHRDNTTPLSAFRKFAVTINLNAEEYEGGDLCFPEYGTGLYRCPTGGAVVFSCTLRHEAKPISKGRRFAYLPFLYDRASHQQYVAAHRQAFPESHPDG